MASAASSLGLGAGRALLTTTLASLGVMGSGMSLDGPFSSAAAVGILALIIAVHEAGHFTAARAQGIHVTKFAIGFGPALLKYQGPEVEYSLRLIPLGGFVAFPEDDPTKVDEKGDPIELLYPADDPNLLNNRSIPERALVISAGVIANVIFAFVALLVQASTVGKAITEFSPGVRLPTVPEGSPARLSGLQSGDVVLTMDGWKIPADASQVGEVVRRIRLSEGRNMKFTVQRDGTVVPMAVSPDLSPDGSGRIGVQIFSNARIEHVKAADTADAFKIASAEFVRLSSVVADGLKKIFTNFSGVSGQLSGPVAIVAAGSEIARTDSAGLFQFCAIININLAAVNVLPLPALDGGYLALLALGVGQVWGQVGAT
ncbi:hypothetical protein FOA52_011737 [Chlamydomonas sp. UWO 241]|nr:hypothetical protein FOA52_011737 [Chlamydomonas sp. UWO 241]